MNVHGDGTLIYKEGDWTQEATWWLKQFDGTELRLPLMYLPGHDARIACATKFDAERMQELLSKEGLGQVEALGTQAQSLQDILRQIQDATKEK